MKNLPVLLICILSFVGCVASAKGLFNAQVAENIKVAEKVTGAEKVNAQGEFVVGKKTIQATNNTNKTESGRDTINDSSVILGYIKSDLIENRMQLKMYEKVIKFLSFALILFTCIGYAILGFVIVYLLLSDSKKDRFNEGIIKNGGDNHGNKTGD